MAIGKRKKKNSEDLSVSVPQTSKNSHPFANLSGYFPSDKVDLTLYSSLREGVPIIDAAILKLVRLLGTFEVKCKNKQAEESLKYFLKNVKVGSVGKGIDKFVSCFFEQFLTYGTAVGEMVFDGKEITHLFNADLKDIALSSGENPLDIVISADNGNGQFLPVRYPELILIGTHNAPPGKVYGTSVLKGLPFVSDILLKIYNTIGLNWERVGNVRFAVTYKPQNDTLDKAYAKERAMQVASQWSQTMRDSTTIRDFVAVGDVSIKAIGADNQILDSEIPVRQMLEQIVAKLGLPPFLLGLSWSTTERMSSQQADILTSEIDYYRKEIEPIIRKICSMYLRTKGMGDEFSVVWNDITLQDITELAQGRYYDAQAKKILSELGGENSYE